MQQRFHERISLFPDVAETENIWTSPSEAAQKLIQFSTIQTLPPGTGAVFVTWIWLLDYNYFFVELLFSLLLPQSPDYANPYGRDADFFNQTDSSKLFDERKPKHNPFRSL